MNGSEDILANHAFVEHDSILVVVTLPRHVCHKKVTSQSQFTVLSGITLSEDIALMNMLTLLADGAEVDGHVLVRTAELGNGIFLNVGIEAYKFFVL